jgi:hypothetical protein
MTTNGAIDPFIDSYQVELSRDYITWQDVRVVTGTSTVYQNITPGVYYARVQSIDIAGKVSTYIYSSAFTVQVSQTAPKPITTEKQDFTNTGNSASVWFY